MRILKISVSVLAILSLVLFVIAFSSIRNIQSEQITPDLHVLYGLGGNVGVLKTGEGAVIVDTMTFNMQGSMIREMAESLTGEQVVMVINTHYHSDHTHGNPAFAPGTRVISTERTLHHLKTTDSSYFSDEAASLLPNETISSTQTLRLGNKTLLLVHPGRGHTDGDLVVVFQEDKAVHLGDLFFNRLYPNIDLEGGGSVQNWGNSLDEVLKLSFDSVIPGHGKMATREDLLQFQQFIRQLASVGTKAASEGKSLAAFQESSGLTEDAGYSEVRMIIPVGLNRNFVLKRSWEEANNRYIARD